MEVIDYIPPEEKSYTVPIILLITLALVSAFFMYASIFPFVLININRFDKLNNQVFRAISHKKKKNHTHSVVFLYLK